MENNEQTTNDVYKTHFTMYKTKVCPLKQHDGMVIRQLIGGARLHEELVFDGYGEITFDEADRGNMNPIITVHNNCEYKRSKTNCLVYSIVSKRIEGKFDKMVIYPEEGTLAGRFGFVVFNTSTDAYIHKYLLKDEPQEILLKLEEIFGSMKIQKTFDHITMVDEYLKNNTGRSSSRKKKRAS